MPLCNLSNNENKIYIIQYPIEMENLKSTHAFILFFFLID